MSEYRQTLERFQRYILDEDTAMETNVIGKDLEFRQTRLNVYHDGYMLRLVEIMGKCFPALKLHMGETLFDDLCREYLAAYPSRHFSVAMIGQHFSQFLSMHAQAELLHVEMAEFEWILEEVIVAADAPQLTFDEMAASLGPEDWASLRLQYHPSLMDHPFRYPIPAFWQHLMRQQTKPEIVCLEEPVQWLIWRFNRRAHFIPMTVQQVALFELIQAGQTFAEICGEFSVRMNEDEVVGFVAGTIRQWVEEGIFSAASS